MSKTTISGYCTLVRAAGHASKAFVVAKQKPTSVEWLCIYNICKALVFEQRAPLGSLTASYSQKLLNFSDRKLIEMGYLVKGDRDVE